MRTPNIFLLEVPFDSGHYKKRLGLGPAHLQAVASAFLREHNFKVTMETLKPEENLFPTEATRSFQVNRAIAQTVSDARSRGEFPVVFAGNCNTSSGTLGGLNEKNVGVIWFDCHGDFNTPETTVGGYLDGMSIAMITGRCWKNLTSSIKGFTPVEENNVVLIGARDLDLEEAKQLSHSLIRLVTPQTLKANVNALADNFPEVGSIYLHIDLDVLDPSFLKVNEYSTIGGLTPDELVHALNQIKQRYNIAAIAFTAYDPSLDPDKKINTVITRILEAVIVS